MERLTAEPRRQLGELKELVETLGIIAVAAAAQPELASVPPADMLATLVGQNEHLNLEIVTAETSDAVVLPFEYRPDTHRFDECSPS